MGSPLEPDTSDLIGCWQNTKECRINLTSVVMTLVIRC